MRSDKDRLLDILEAISKVEEKLDCSYEVFCSDEMLQVWVIHHLQIIGEACSKLTRELRSKYSDIRWHGITGMRNILVHQYFGVDVDVVWYAANNDLPELYSYATQILGIEFPETE